jgi:MoxR-like ATPase
MVPEGPLIGRERELLALELALGAERLVTVTGAGGCGKTRVARELAARIEHRPNAVPAVVIELATIRRGDLLVDASLRGAATSFEERRIQAVAMADGWR